MAFKDDLTTKFATYKRYDEVRNEVLNFVLPYVDCPVSDVICTDAVCVGGQKCYNDKLQVERELAELRRQMEMK